MKLSAQLPNIFWIVASLIALPVSAIPLPLHSESTVLRPRIKKDRDGFSSCAVRAVVGVAETDYMSLYDIIIDVDVKLFSGVLDISKQRSPMDELEKIGKRTWKTITPAPTVVWIAKEEGKGKPIVHNETLTDAEDGHLFGMTDIVPAYGGIMSIIHGERMLLAVKYKDQPDFTVVRFAETMEKNDRLRLKACLEGVVKRLKKERLQH